LAIRSSHLSVSAQALVGVVRRTTRRGLRGLFPLGREPVLDVVTVLAAARFEVRERALADSLEPIGIVCAVRFRFLERLRVLIHVGRPPRERGCKVIASVRAVRASPNACGDDRAARDGQADARE
jgi:hypothetical protein